MNLCMFCLDMHTHIYLQIVCKETTVETLGIYLLERIALRLRACAEFSFALKWRLESIPVS